MIEKQLSLMRLETVMRRMSEDGKVTVLATGCFDVLHVGHVRLLGEARRQGDTLVVGLNDDATVRALKGRGRPVNSASDRAEVIAALSAVDYVCVFFDPTPVDLILRTKPSVFVKGADYRIEDLPEAAAVQAGGGRIHLARYHAGFSTTGILAARRPNETE